MNTCKTSFAVIKDKLVKKIPELMVGRSQLVAHSLLIRENENKPSSQFSKKIY